MKISSWLSAFSLGAVLFVGCASASTSPSRAPESTAVAVRDDQAVHAVAATPATPPEVLSRIAVVGASVSQGFGLQLEFGGRDVGLDAFLAGALPKTTELLGLGDAMVFLDPRGTVSAQIDEALAFEPTLVVGVDVLFWFAYGRVFSEESRLERFEVGLKELERFECPIVVADIPDMRVAVDGISPIGPMLNEAQVPDPETLVALNARLVEWASERAEQVTIVPLADFASRALAGEALSVHGNDWEAGIVEDFLQDDLLHPTAEGTVALTVLLLAQLLANEPEVEPWVAWEAQALEERLRRNLGGK